MKHWITFRFLVERKGFEDGLFTHLPRQREAVLPGLSGAGLFVRPRKKQFVPENGVRAVMPPHAPVGVFGGWSSYLPRSENA